MGTLAFELSLRGFRGNAESAVTVEVVKPEIRGTVTAIDKDFQLSCFLSLIPV